MNLLIDDIAVKVLKNFKCLQTKKVPFSESTFKVKVILGKTLKQSQLKFKSSQNQILQFPGNFPRI